MFLYLRVRRVIFKDFVVRVNNFHAFLVHELKKFGKHCNKVPKFNRKIIFSGVTNSFTVNGFDIQINRKKNFRIFQKKTTSPKDILTMWSTFLFLVSTSIILVHYLK
jgi:hypothetical protein